jgi:lipopolysaccharide/colanic/teichoic acid biosynthesis glycosyltransferase
MVIAEGRLSQAGWDGLRGPAFDQARVGRRSESPWAGPLLLLTVFLVAFAIMPAVYALMAFHGNWTRALRAPAPGHILFIAAANAVVMVSAVSVQGRLDRRLAGVIGRTLVVHGAVAFVILVTRQWYSLPILMTGLVASAVLGGGVAMIRQRAAPQRIGVIGPPHPVMRVPAVECTPIEDPAEPIGRFELILITEAGDLPAIWLPTLARALLAGKRIRHVSELLEEITGAVALEHFDVDQLPPGGFSSYRTRKRLFDLVCVTAALPLAVPVVMLACLGILLTMGRPVLFFQTRVGLGGRSFRMVKLRTMHAAQAAGAGQATTVGDPRVTAFGRWLRRFRIDEIPQLWNVVAGDMSFIGPRPEWSILADAFAAQEKTYSYRHLVRPGITGWAQVKGAAAADLAETRIKLGYDLFYLKHLSFSLDLQILLRTIWTLVAGDGAR